MKGMIIYKSNTGSTGEYAAWLSEETGFVKVESGKVRDGMIRECDTVLIGCPIYAGNPLLAKWVRKKWTLLKDKRILLFTTSGAKGNDPEILKWYEKAFTPEERSLIEYHPLPGRMKFDELSPVMRFMMKLGSRMVKDPVEREKMFAEFDNVGREHLAPVLNALA